MPASSGVRWRRLEGAMRKVLFAIGAVAVVAGGFLTTWPVLNAQPSSIKIKAVDIGGVVTSAQGPEAGVWVIAETTDLPTKFTRIVVTDDQGRYLVPDLPKATYEVWARGYGLADSSKTKAEPGQMLNLMAMPAPNAKAAAENYPAQYWLSLLRVPGAHDFPGTG